MKKSYLVSFLILLSGISFGQSTFIFKGTLQDAKTNEAIPFAHINIEGRPGKGFISRINGHFFWDAFDSKDTILAVRISALGYVSKKVTLYSNQFNDLKLQPAVEQLNAIVVTPIDWERLLVQRVIEKIPENYSNKNERLRGVVTEETYVDSALTIPFYTSRVLIEADKPSYSNKAPVGNVRVISGETKYFAEADTSWIKIMAGGYNVFRFDLASNRRGPLRIGQLKNYEFSVRDTLLQDDDMILALAFSGKAYNGTLFINLTDTALMQADVVDVEFEASRGGSGLSYSERLFLHYSVSYDKFDGAYRLRHIHYQTGFLNDNDVMFLENTFSIIGVEDASETKPEGKAINFSELLTDYTQELEIRNDSTFEAPQIPNLLKFIRKLTFGYSIYGIPEARKGFAASFTEDFEYGKTWEPINRNRIAFGVVVEYPIYKRLSFSGQLVSAGEREATGFTTLGLSYSQPLNFSGRYQLALGMDYVYFLNTSRFYTHNHDERIVINNDVFDSGEIHFLYRQISNGISPRLAFDVKLNNAVSFRLQGAYHFPIANQQNILAEEANEYWFWNRSSTVLAAGSDFESSQSKPYTNNWWVGFGIIWK